MHYEQYLFAQLLNHKVPSFAKLPYDEQFEVSKKLYGDFVKSDYNNSKRGVYECIEDFIKGVQGYSTYSIAEDHANIKKQIKEWEKEIDHVITLLDRGDVCGLVYDLEHVAQEMMAINI